MPALRLDLPLTAIGKDYLGLTIFIDHAPSGTGWQVSLLGLAGVTVARDEGFELNLLGVALVSTLMISPCGSQASAGYPEDI